MRTQRLQESLSPICHALGLPLIVLCSACVSSDPYPASWPERMFADAECPDISGTYQNVGLASNGILFCPGCGERGDYRECARRCSDKRVQLSEILFASALDDAGRVSISAPADGRLRARFESDNPSAPDRLLVRGAGDFECHSGQIWLLLDRELEVDIGGVARSTRRLGLVKAEDGSLIGEFRYKGAGVVFVAVPAGWSERHFIKWSVAESDASFGVEDQSPRRAGGYGCD